jgi:hypothetical protein
VELMTDLLARVERFSQDAAAEVGTWETTGGLGLTPDSRARLEQLLASHAAHRA